MLALTSFAMTAIIFSTMRWLPEECYPVPWYHLSVPSVQHETIASKDFARMDVQWAVGMSELLCKRLAALLI